MVAQRCDAARLAAVLDLRLVPGAAVPRRLSPPGAPAALDVGPDEAPVDLVDRTGDVGRLLRGQERDEATEFHRVAEPADRDARGDRRQLFLQRPVALGAAPRARDDPGGEE